MASLTNEAAASSSSSSLPLSSTDHQNHYTYEVFLSFRGEDTRYDFTDHLYRALCLRGIKTFRDDTLSRGEDISQELLKAIDESRVSIVVFSQNYASSRWCLDELVKILECRKSKRQEVRPVFYKVAPSDVRHQRGAFGDAFATLDQFYKDSMDKWKAALKEAADLSGWTFEEGRYETEFINDIVGELSTRVVNPSCEWHVAEYPIGLESCIQDVESLLKAEENIFRMVGIWGTGGIGKTTIAKAVFNSIRHKFETSCFLADVRSNTNGLAQLQERLLHDLLRDSNLKVSSVDKGVSFIKERMQNKKVLLILDDVSRSSQLKNLVPSPDCFGSGSRILITTREKRWLISHEVNEVYEVKMLDDRHALELFSLHAFKRNEPPSDYLELAQHVIRYAQGLPLALIVLGSHLFRRSTEEWEATIGSCKGGPQADIHKVLKLSYDALGRDLKELFLDIACFFKGERAARVKPILEACYDHKTMVIGIAQLQEKALIRIDKDDQIWMHDLIEEMGTNIVYQESPDEPGERSRLWSQEDVDYVLTNNTGTNKVIGIQVPPCRASTISLNAKSFSEMKNLRYISMSRISFSGDIDYLSNQLRWLSCRLQCFPSDFQANKLVELNISWGKIRRLWEGRKNFSRLTCMNLSGCKSLEELPDLSGIPNLKRLNLSGCESLKELPDLSGIPNLKVLNLSGCVSLKELPDLSGIPNLNGLNLSGYESLKKLPDLNGIPNLKELNLSDSKSLKELPDLSGIPNLNELNLSGCESLKKLPDLSGIPNLKELNLSGCKSLKELPELSGIPNLKVLNLGGCTSLKKLPDLSGIPNLKGLNLSGRESLKELPDLSRRQATNEIEPTLPQLTEGFEAVEATTQATNGNSEPASQWKHDVFLSFRGEDTRKGFLSHLYHELQNTKVIRTFKDDEQLEKGKDISHSLLTAIEESRFAIIVLSENYAFSAWCLDELTKIVQCMEGKVTILPIFYHVAPSDIRRQKGQFEVAFTKHESDARYDREKVKQWRADLTKVGNLSGWDSNNHKSERELIEDIVKVVLKKVSQTPRGDFEEFEATREAMDEVKEMLNDDKITAIGVYGREGVGKTAMVKHVGAQAKRIGLFDHVVLAVISENPDLQKIQGELVNQLGLELVVDEEIERASRLKDRIMGGKRILIILDDIWEIIDLSSIGIPSYDELQRCNSKVLLTTRIRNICQSMGCQAHIRLNILSEQDSLKLFMKKSRKPFQGSTDSYDEERNVVSKCSGLPSVLEEAAREFGHKYVEEWNKAVSKAFGDDDDEFQKAAQELNASQPVPTKDGRDTFKGIELSYHTLRFDDAKSFFLLCCMFPEDYDIPIEDLFKYGIGKGLLQYSDTLQEARDTAHSLVAYLKDSGLLLDGKKGCIKMNFDVRKAISIALSEGHAFFVKAGCELKDWPMDTHERYSAISLMRNKLNKLPETLVCSELQILLLQSNAGICDIPQTFFQSPNALRIFDLSYTSISVLPSSFSLLTNLQALHLDCCKKITDISVLGKLKKVEILSLRKFPLKELPEEIGNLTSLRMLDVTGGCVHKIPSEVISRLYRLEELYMKCEFGDWGSKVEEAVGQTNADFDEIIGLSHLNILKVYISDAACLPKDIRYFEPNWVKFDICISRDLSSEMMLSSNDQPSRTLTLDRTINGLSDWFINVVTEKAEKLEYRECKGLKNILKEYEHGRLHGLRHLSVIGCHERLEELINVTTWDPSKPVFERLEELHLLHLQCLKELCVGELPLGSLCNLKLLKVQTCCNLVNALLPPKLLQRLSNLETIFCVNMEHMKYVFGFEGLEPEMNLLRKLSEMRLCALFGLISIWNGPAPPAVFCNLKVLAVCRCTKLKSLFPFDVARSLLQLEDLSVEHCPSLGRVIEASNSLNRFIPFVALKKLVLKNLPELTWFCTKNGTVDIECPWLEYLYVNECPKCPQFINSASASVKLNDQQHLNSLVKRWKDMYNL